MKAVIMAGGKGSRLRPLTCNKPKPMVPLLNKPVMEYAIELLKKHGITEIAVTLQYLPANIKDYFGDGSAWGVELHYFEETAPLGTAGSVKNAEAFLDESFVVISGDGLTDINISEAIQFHQEKQALATLVLTRVEAPLEYGVVITKEDGEISRFLEKPSWGEVFSDTVNTGIYILEPTIFDYVPKDTPFDFSNDLFPTLLKEHRPLFGYTARGYWCDIGNLSQYRQTQFDMLDGKVEVNIKGTQVAPGIWVGSNVKVDVSKIKGPCYIADNCKIHAHIQLGEYTILGENNNLRTNLSIKRTVVWNNNYIAQGAELRGTTVCNYCTVKQNVALFEGSVVGDHCLMDQKSILRPNVKLWPSKHVEENSIVHTSLIWGEKISKNIFGQLGVTGIANVEITSDYVAKLAAAYGSTLKRGSLVVISDECHPFAQIIKRVFIAGLLSAGINTIDIGTGTTPVTRYGVKALGAQGGVHVRFVSPMVDNRVLIEFLDYHGINIDKGWERKVENAYVQEDFRRESLNNVGYSRYFPQFSESYINDLMGTVDIDEIRRRRFRVVLEYDTVNLGKFMPVLFDRLGCEVLTINSSTDDGIDIGDIAAQFKADLAFSIDRNGERVAIRCSNGKHLSDEVFMALLVVINMQGKHRKVMAVPVTASEVMERIAEQLEGEIIRTKANPRSLMEVTAEEPFQVLFDGLFAVVSIMNYLATHQCQLGDLLQTIPDFFIQQELVPCSWAEKGKVMRKLIEDTARNQVELVDGVKVYHEKGWTLVLPDSEEPLFRVFSEANSQEVAEELAASYAEKIRGFKAEN